MLYQNGFLQIIPDHTAETFWKSFEHSLSLNKRGVNGKQRTLSIIADYFPYKELQSTLYNCTPLGTGYKRAFREGVHL